MARIKIELADTEDGGMICYLEADDLATMKTFKTNTLTQNSAIILMEALEKCGINNDRFRI